jgi:excisionase family DNA binding protein
MAKLLRLEEAAAASGITPRTIRRRVANGEIPAVIDPRDRRRKLIRITDLRRYVGEVGLQKAS